MKLLSIERRNYKNHRVSVISECGDFHALIGRNSGGKSSLFEAILFAKSRLLGNAAELVNGGVSEFATKEIAVTLFLAIADFPKEGREGLDIHFCKAFGLYLLFRNPGLLRKILDHCTDYL